MKDELKASFSAANVVPIKTFLEKELYEHLIEGHIPAYHIQLSPTNVCNFNCEFCSCGNVDRAQCYDWDELKNVLDKAVNVGLRCVTITGGGEPLSYPNVNELYAYLADNDVQIGMVTNGTLLHRLNNKSRDAISWIRLSASDTIEHELRTVGRTIDSWLDGIADFRAKGILGQDGLQDFAFSYVVGPNPDFELIHRLIEFGNKHEFTNIRIVPDLNKLDTVPEMDEIETFMTEKYPDMNIDVVNYQGRSEYTRGQKDCWISLLKPFIAADGYIYPCCGVQYAKGETLDFDKTMRLGNASDIDSIISKQIPYCGDDCEKCYYKAYNNILGYYKHPERIVGKRFV